MAKRTTKKVEEKPEEVVVEGFEEVGTNELPLVLALMMNAMNKTKESTKAKQSKIYEAMSNIQAVRK